MQLTMHAVPHPRLAVEANSDLVAIVATEAAQLYYSIEVPVRQSSGDWNIVVVVQMAQEVAVVVLAAAEIAFVEEGEVYSH